MSLLLHAITPADAAEDMPPAGLRGQPLVRLEQEALAAWATRFVDPPAQLSRADLLAHHDLIVLLHERLDSVIPARFPTWLAEGEAPRALLSSKRGDLLSVLDRVRGKTEIALTALWVAADDEAQEPEAATPGTRYLLSRQRALAGSDRRRARAQQVAEQLEHLAGSELVAVQRQVCPSTTVALSEALLVPRASASAVKARLSRVEPDVRILVTGPWPPYSFVDIK
jgi:hypothetical protein